MAIVVAKTDMNKAGWQKLRKDVSDMESSGVGKALESFKADYAKGSKANWDAGAPVWSQALKRGVEVTKALGVAKGKANGIKDPVKKKLALEVVAGFESVVAKFADEILTLEDNRKKAIAGLTFEKMIASPETMKAFLAHADSEHSRDEAEAAIGWQQKKYKEVTLKYGPDNVWNQEAETTRQLLAHYNGKKAMESGDLKFALDKVTNGFSEMVSGGNSLFSRFKKKLG